MPVDDRIQILQFGILLLCVPAQYLVSRYYTASEGERVYALRNLYSDLTYVKERYLSPVKWVDWCLSLIRLRRGHEQGDGAGAGTGSLWDDFTVEVTEGGSTGDSPGESPAVEVLKYRYEQQNGQYFGRSVSPRDSRSPHMKFRVGQVVKHETWGYRGVIVGWDATAQAPASWIDENHPADKPGWQYQPNYAVLVDTRDRIAPQVTYVPQDNISVIGHTQIYHPSLDEFFENFDGMQYLPRPWLRTVYPYG